MYLRTNIFRIFLVLHLKQLLQVYIYTVWKYIVRVDNIIFNRKYYITLNYVRDFSSYYYRTNIKENIFYILFANTIG